MNSLKHFQVKLCEAINPDGVSWSYHVPNLPRPRQSDAANLIKCLSVVSSESSEYISLHFEVAPSNRITRTEPLDRLILISFTGFRLRWPSTSSQEPRQVATARQSAAYIARLLVNGVILNGTSYYFFGHSNSQLKSRSCFLYAASKEEISAKIERMGDLSKLKSVAKKAKRIGLLFSSAEMALTLSPNRCEDINDINFNGYNFTDGCGLISVQLANQLVQRRRIAFRGQRYRPSVFQIRYRGYKGVLTLDPALTGQIQVQFRESMRKFKDAQDHSFSVVDYSKPYMFGYLNDEVVVLLHTLGVSSETLLLKQAQHLDFLQMASKGDVRATFQFLSYVNRVDLAEKLLLDGIEPLREGMRSLVKKEYARMLKKRDEQRCRILIPKSRLLFGICDPTSKDGCTGKLKEGECFIRITLDGDGRPHTIINTEVLVTRNPCLHPGDLQKFRAVDVPQFAGHLVDCIVFSTRGRRPSADLMSGGDLDGDKFFVTWDSDIIPSTMAEPAAYPGGKELVTFGPVTDDQRAEYFAHYSNASLGKVKELYMKWARLGNAMSPECQQLNRLFSQCVDGNRITIPESLRDFEKLQDGPEPNRNAGPFILDLLHASSVEFLRDALDAAPDTTDDADVVDLLLSRDQLALSEFEMIQLTLRWCNHHGADIVQFAHLFHFSALSDEQRIWFLSRLPPSASAPSLVRNGLLQSSLVAPEEWRRFGLDHPHLHWKPIFYSGTDRMGRYFDALCCSLEIFHKKLVILQVDERLTLAMYIPHKVPRTSECQVDTSVRVFALPHSQGNTSSNYKVLPTKVNYRLYCDEHQFQLYEHKRSNTWIFMTKPQADDSLYRNEKQGLHRRRKKQQTIDDSTNFSCVISVALNKIGADLQRHVGKVQRQGVLGAEIYAISNRDTSSMNMLDQWLHFVDTEETLPLFQPLDIQYTVSKLDTVDWGSYSPSVVAVARDRNVSQLRQSNSVHEWRDILELLEGNGEIAFLREVYRHMLFLEASNGCPMKRTAVAFMLLEFLPSANYLIPLFLQSQIWISHKAHLEEKLAHLAPSLFAGLVLASNEFQDFIRQPFFLLLQELTQMSFHGFAELVELVALSVRSPEPALDILLEMMEPQMSRLSIGRPFVLSRFAKSLSGIALDHIEEAASYQKPERETVQLEVDDFEGGFAIAKCTIRIDSSLNGILKIGDHIRLTASGPPENAPLSRPASIDALVLSTMVGSATLKCIHKPPSFVSQCAWLITRCGSFVTSKISFDAVLRFCTEREACCQLFASLVGLPNADQSKPSSVELPFRPNASLNRSQNAALEAAMKHSLTFIWGPPGTGKTHTIAVILGQLLNALPRSRFLVTAPTHNAVDNLLRRFIDDGGNEESGAHPLRVSTQISRVSSDLRAYTCDAMVGRDLSNDLPARRQAQRRIKAARLVFTTCVGAGLGLLRTEGFDVVIIDEASQQTEPATLIPLVKGCFRAILVGDHVQLRAIVQQHAVVTGFDVSLFERHYTNSEREDVAKEMLDQQYRMHRTICDFSSYEFYQGKLGTAVEDSERSIPASLFPWSNEKRLIWLECSTPEDVGRQSKANLGQAERCKRVVQLLSTIPELSPPSCPKGKPSMAILTPYTRQKELLQSSIPDLEVSSIDGFQGREADIIIFVTVRCNAYNDMGFLTDMRRLNVVMTRARMGVILIGNKGTLTGQADGNGHEDSKRVWERLIGQCHVLECLPDAPLPSK